MQRNIITVFLIIGLLSIMPFKVTAVSLDGISADSYVIIEASTGVVVASGNEFEKRPMASTTKIMTTLLLLESGNLDEEFMVNNDAIKVEGSSMGLCDGDIVTKRALCYGMMLPSGNDAANQAAVLLAGNIENFSVMMNERASKIGLKSTNFVTPSGLHDDNHYSTAYDMAHLTREALKNETFREICGTQRVKTKFGNPSYERWLVNTNKLLYMYEYCIGVKTGFTDEAGRCLVSAAEKDGVVLICVTLDASDDWNDHMKLYDYGFSVTESEPIEFSHSDLFVNIAGGYKTRVAVAPLDTPLYTKVNGKEYDFTHEIIIDNFMYAPVVKGQSVGKINFYTNNQLIFSTPLVAQENCGAVICEYKPSLFDNVIEYIRKML